MAGRGAGAAAAGDARGGAFTGPLRGELGGAALSEEAPSCGIEKALIEGCAGIGPSTASRSAAFRGMPPFASDLFHPLVQGAGDLAVDAAKLARRELVGASLGEPVGLDPKHVERPRVLDEGEADAERGESERDEHDEAERHRLLVLGVEVVQKSPRRADEVRRARHRVPRAEVPRFADEARVDDAQIAVQRAHVAEALLFVRRIALDTLQIRRDRIELRGVEPLGGAGRNARAVRRRTRSRRRCAS